jgi:hypothetical protein
VLRLLHHAHFGIEGGFRTFAAVSSKGSSAQEATFAKSGRQMYQIDRIGPEPPFVTN